MKRFEINGKYGPSSIMVGEKVSNLYRYITPVQKGVVITDTNVESL